MGELATLLAGGALGALFAGVVFVARDLVRVAGGRQDRLEAQLRDTREELEALTVSTSGISVRAAKLEQAQHAHDRELGQLCKLVPGATRYPK